VASTIDDTVRSLFKGGGVLFAGLVIELGISFLATLLIARVLGTGGFGTVSLGRRALAMISTVVLVGMNTGVGRYLPRYEDTEHRRGVLVSAFHIVIPLSILTGGAMAYFAPTLTKVLNAPPIAVSVFRVFAVTVPFAAVVKLAVGGVQGMKHSLPKVYIRNLSQPITRFVGIAVALAFGFEAVGVAWAYALSYAIGTALGLYYLFRRTPLVSAIEYVPMYRDLLRFSAPLMVTASMTLVLANLDTFIIAGYSQTTDPVGVYNAVYPLAELLSVLLSAFGFLFMPVISELHANDQDDELERLYQVITKWIFIAIFPLFSLFVLFPEVVITLTFGPEYATGAPALAVLSVGWFVHSVAGLNVNALTAIGRTRVIMYDNLFVAALNVGLNLLLVPEYGILGAAVATAISYIVLNALYTTQLYRANGTQPFSMALVRPGLTSALLVGVLYLALVPVFGAALPVILVLFFLFLVVYAIIILRFGGIEGEEIMLVLSFEERFDIDLGPLKTIAQKLLR